MHADIGCNVVGAPTGDLGDGEVIFVFVRNLGANDVIISNVFLNGDKLTAENGGSVISVTNPAPKEWGIVTNVSGACGATATLAAGTPIKSARDATIAIAYSADFGEDIKLGRPIFIKLETSAANIFTKQIVNGRQIG